MIDPLTNLAFALYSNKGVYALLIGSGVSSAAQIPTGYSIVVDLIRKIARVRSEDCEPDPATWWKKNSGNEPDYSELLNQLAKTRAERQGLLKQYFEASVEEQKEGVKVPTAAHKAIAWLAAEGFVRVVVTTNFDRLLEQAFEAQGVNPTVIGSADQVRGAPPLTHAGATIIKVNGDYLDTRIRNTEAELVRYERPMTKLLNRVFDEYGLVLCGWSADWDIALRDCITRAPSRRFTTFFAVRGTPSDAMKRLIAVRGGELIRIEDANTFFSAVEAKVRALREENAPHPLSTSIAVATAKRYLAEPTAKIRLHDLVFQEVERVHDTQLSKSFPLDVNLTAENVLSQTRRYEAMVSTLLALVVTGSYWGDDSHTKLWVHALERIGNVPSGSGYDWAVKLRRYPALILLYGGGLAAIAAKKFPTVATLLERPIERKDGEELPLLLSIQPFAIMLNDVGHLLPGMNNNFTPLSDHLHTYLRDFLRPFLADDLAYDAIFDEFEYLMALVAMDMTIQLSGGRRASYGRFAWKGRNLGVRKLSSLEKLVEEAGDQWPPVKAGLFGGSGVRVIKAKVGMRDMIDSFNWL